MNTSAWIEALGWTLIHFVWQGVAIAACLWAALQLASNARAQLRYVISCAALAACVLIAAGTFARESRAPRGPARAIRSMETHAVASPVARTERSPVLTPIASEERAASAASDLPPSSVDPAPDVSLAPQRTFQSTVAAVQSCAPWIVLSWFGGVAWCSLRLCRGWHLVQRLRRSGEHQCIGVLHQRFAALAETLGVRRATELLVSASVQVPMVMGWLKPVVLIPASILTGLSSAQVEAILAHELAHIRRNDYVVNLVQSLIETILFYNPAVWWMSAQIRKEREHCCDDLAARVAGGPILYVSALTALEESRGNASVLAMAANGGALLSRARRLLNARASEGPARGSLAGGLALLVLLAVFVVPLTLLEAADEKQPAEAPQPTRASQGSAKPDTGTQPTQAELYEHRSRVDQLRNELLVLEKLSPEDLPRSLQALGLDNDAALKIHSSLWDAVAAERKLAATGLAEDHPRLKTLQALVAFHRKALADQLQRVQRGQREKLMTAEARLKSLEEQLPPEAKSNPKLTAGDLAVQRQHVEKTKSQLAALEKVKPDELSEALRLLGIEDETARKTLAELKAALAEKKLLDAGQIQGNPRQDVLGAEIVYYRKVLSDQLESMKRAHRTKLLIEETQLKTMEAHFAERAKSSEPKHEQTRDVLKLWRGEYKEAPSVPAEAMHRVAKQVKKFIEQAPGEDAETFRKMLPQLEAERAWPWTEAATMLDTLCDVATAPVGWTELTEQFRAFNRAKKGEAWTAEVLAKLPFGPANEQGLRAAWIFEPMQPSYAVGDVLKSRIIFHNAGVQPIEFRTDAWHQEDTWKVKDAAGNPVKVKTTWYTGLTPLQRFHLEPGQVAEVAGHGAGIGAADYQEKYSVGAIGAEIPAKPGDELRCSWEVTFHPTDGDVNSPMQARLTTGEVKFRVVAADPNAPKPPGVATGPGRYDLAPGYVLQISQLTTSPVDAETGKQGPTQRLNTAAANRIDPSADAALKSRSIELPQGIGTYVIAWPRGGRALWVGEIDGVRKVDLTATGKFPLRDVAESIADPVERDAALELAKKQRVDQGTHDEKWKWDAGSDFGGIPADVRTLLEKHRPKLTAAVSTPPAEAREKNLAKEKAPWRASGRVTDQGGKPLEGIEIWVHTGQGSLFRTGLTKTNAEGRYEVAFTPGIMMEKDSPQLQFANITAHKPGLYETNLNRQGAGAAAMRAVSDEDLKGFGVTSTELVLPDKPREVNFQLAKAIKVKGRLLGTGSFPRLPPQDYRGKEEKPVAGYIVHREAPLPRWKVWLTGPKLAPATGVFASTETDQEGRFEFADIPPGFEWQVQADSHHRGNDPRSPLFRPEPNTDTVLELELGEAQKELKFLPSQKKDGASSEDSGEVLRWPVKLVDGESGAPVLDASVRVFALPGDAKTAEILLKPGTDGLVEIPFASGKTGAIQVAAPGRWTNSFIWLGADAKGMPDKNARPDPATPIVVQLWRGTTVTGRLLSPDGNAMPGTPLIVGVYINNQEWKKRLGMDLSHYSWDHGDWPNWSTSAITRDDGTFETVVPPPDARNWVRVGTTQLGFGSISPVGADRAILDFAPFESEREQADSEKLAPLHFGDLRLEMGVTLRGRVLDANGQPLVGVHLFTSGTRGPYAGRTVVSGPDGQFEFRPMKPGSFTLTPDGRIRKSGEVDSRDVQAVFVAQPVTLHESPNPMELTVQAVPHVEVVFEWVDRRAKKGPVSYYGEFALNGRVKPPGGEEVNWRGETELVEREGRKVLVVKVPREITNPTLNLVADSVVTASYEDEQMKKSGPGPVALESLDVPMRRTIFGDEPKPRP